MYPYFLVMNGPYPSSIVIGSSQYQFSLKKNSVMHFLLQTERRHREREGGEGREREGERERKGGGRERERERERERDQHTWLSNWTDMMLAVLPYSVHLDSIFSAKQEKKERNHQTLISRLYELHYTCTCTHPA